MYGRQSTNTQPSTDKNPNRITGGLKAQGVDTLVMLGEDGTSTEIPSLAYVRSLEEQSKKQRAAIDVLERKLARQDRSIQELMNAINSRS
jgi:6-phosphofructokinase